MELLNYNGKLYPADKLLISPNNRSFRYGDGFFETMKMANGKIVLGDYHFERLFSSLELLLFEKPDYFTAKYLLEQITELAKENHHLKLSKIRLTIFRSNGGLYNPQNFFPNYIIQTSEYNAANNQLNENGFVADIFKDAKKICDNYSHIKSNNYLPYAMAALWAKKNNLNDALVLNAHNRIADATIANVFILKGGILKTPALTEGCINGVMRKYLLECMQARGMQIEEASLSVDDVLTASEMFLTNSVYGLRWVKQCGGSEYNNLFAAELYKQFIAPL
ncbi:MAG TPA: aminotransferase class IV [Chitinophagaceae bacterium]